MKNTSLRIFSGLTVFILLAWACSFSGGTTAPTAEVVSTVQEEAPTEALSVVELAATQTKLAEQAWTDTPAPTDTPAVTPTETLTPEPSVTPTVGVPLGEVGRESNCRIGPGGNYDLVVTFQAGQMVEIVARDLGGGYVVVRDPAKPETECYMLANSLKISGDVAALPEYTPLASPTAAPSFKVTFKKFEICKGEPFAVFVVQNTGSVPFRSGYIKVTDQKVNKSVEQAVNAFDQYTGCIIAKNIAPLEAGASGFINSPIFKVWDPRGNKLRAVIMACTEKNLKGTCAQTSVDVSPK